MNEVEILREMLTIYKKYFVVVEKLGTLTMSSEDTARLVELEEKLGANYNV